MLLHRRQFLAGAPALLLACKVDPSDSGKAPEVTPERSPEPPDWEPPGVLDETAFAWGLQAGDATTTSVWLSFRSVPTQVEVVVVEGAGDAWVEIHRESLERVDETRQFLLEGLKPDQVYRWAVYDPSTGNHSRIGRFRTAPETGTRRVLRFGATSCLGGNEPWPNLSFAAGEAFDFFLLLGDTVYADGASTLEDYREYWRHAMTVEGLKAVTASASVVATWDDHEVGNNWKRDTLADGQYDAAFQAYRESLPQGTGDQGQIWRTLSFGDMVELFVLDCRSERTESLYLSVEQMDWLKQALSESKARFKLILNSVPINDYTDMFGVALDDDRWQGYPAQRSEILAHIADNAIPGVLWISGDVHHGMI